MQVSRLDKFYKTVRKIKLFSKGWGKSEDLLRLIKFRKLVADRSIGSTLVDPNYPVKILREQKFGSYFIIEGTFKSPLASHCPGMVPKIVQNVFFQMVLPLKWHPDGYKPMCIHLAGTGDHYFWRRRHLMAKSLLECGIGSLIVENPFYGLRKPKCQTRSDLFYVSDVFVMGGSLIMECMVLLNLCERNGFWPLGITGISMGGHNASLAAACWPKPVVLVPCLSWTTASLVFTEGVLSESVDWDCLQNQYENNRKLYDEVSKICHICDNPWNCKHGKLLVLSSSAIENQKSSLGTQKSSLGKISPYEIMTLIKSSNANELLPASNGTNLLNLLEEKIENLSKFLPSYAGKETVDLVVEQDKEAVWFMKGVMDEFTHVSNYPVPFDTYLTIAVCAENDAYIPREGCCTLEEVWPGSTVKYVDAGHVGAYLWHRKAFVTSIAEAFKRAKCKYPRSDSNVTWNQSRKLI